MVVELKWVVKGYSNNPIIVAVLPPMIIVFFFISVRDGSYFKTPNLLTFHIFLLFADKLLLYSIMD